MAAKTGIDALALLKDDHRTVEKLFKQFEEAGDGANAQKRDLVGRIIRELAVHAAVEEQVFYPALRARDEELEDRVLEALEEHKVAKWTLSALQKMAPTAERFDAKVKVLIDTIRHHIEEEEGELFPKVRAAFTGHELKMLGDTMQKAKSLSPTRAHPRAPDQPPGILLAGPMAAMVDRTRDLMVAGVKRIPTRSAARTLRQGIERGRRAMATRGKGKSGGTKKD